MVLLDLVGSTPQGLNGSDEDLREYHRRRIAHITECAIRHGIERLDDQGDADLLFLPGNTPQQVKPLLDLFDELNLGNPVPDYLHFKPVLRMVAHYNRFAFSARDTNGLRKQLSSNHLTLQFRFEKACPERTLLMTRQLFELVRALIAADWPQCNKPVPEKLAEWLKITGNEIYWLGLPGDNLQTKVDTAYAKLCDVAQMPNSVAPVVQADPPFKHTAIHAITPSTARQKTVFISYRRDIAGKAVARTLTQALTQRGYDVFLDVDCIDAGKWEHQILAEVPRRSHFLLLLTPGALDRCTSADDWVRKEFELAVQSGCNIVPIRDESVDVSVLMASCPDCMKPAFDYQIHQLRHSGYDADIEELTTRYIRPRVVLLKSPVSDIVEAAEPNRAASKRKSQSIFVNPVLDALLLVAFVVTLLLGMNDNWSAAPLIPIALILKGIWIIGDLPHEIKIFAFSALIAIVCGTAILVGNLMSMKAKNEPRWGWWITGGVLLAFGTGVATILAVMHSRRGNHPVTGNDRNKYEH